MARDVGDLGEDKFVSLCTAGDIVATKPKKDKNGWDYFLEFTNMLDKSKPLDSQLTPINCKVQIKSTDIVNNSQRQIKLSAILKLVKDQMPTFICFINFDGMDEIQEIFLVHIDEEIISRVLRRVRECQQQKEPINQSTIAIKHNESHKINNISGLNLKKQIEKFIPNCMHDYIDNKNKILNSVGYNKRSMALNMKFPISMTNDDLINMSMGLKQSIPVAISKITQTRFNIELPFEMPDFVNSSDVSFSINNISNQKATMIIKKSKYSPILLAFDFDVYIDSLQIINNKKMILKNDFLTMYIDFEKETHKLEFYSFQNEDSHTLNEWLNIFRLAYLSKNENKSYYVEVKSNDRVLNSNSECKFNLNNSDCHIVMYDISSKLSNLYRSVGLSDSENIILNDFQNNYTQINSLYDLAFSELKDMNISFNADSEKNNVDIKSALIFPSTIIVNNQYIVFVIILLGITNYENKNYFFIAEERIISDALVINIEDFNNIYFQELIDDMDILKNIKKSFIIQQYIKHPQYFSVSKEEN